MTEPFQKKNEKKEKNPKDSSLLTGNTRARARVKVRAWARIRARPLDQAMARVLSRARARAQNRSIKIG